MIVTAVFAGRPWRVDGPITAGLQHCCCSEGPWN